MNRRELLGRAGAGFGMMALADLLGRRAAHAADDRAARPLAARPGHHAAKARAVIWLFMEGGPSGFDTFDPKPELQKADGKRVPIETFFGDPGPLLRSPFQFAQHGDSGLWVCDQYPQVARHADQLALIKSCWSESSNHAPAMFQMNTGMIRPGFPSVGSWMTYGLGSENENLPGFVVLGNNRGSKGGPLNWNAGFLPTTYQGTLFRAQGTPILNLSRPAAVRREDQRAQLDLLARMDERHRAARPGEPELLARLQSFELAFRMQSEAGALADASNETEETRALYGLGDPQAAGFGAKCLLARRLVAKGVRFVQVYCDDEWDAHQNIRDNHTAQCRRTDKGIAGLLADLKRTGLLDSTLVIWGGEFGRMPVSEKGKGRDHNPHGFCTWMAGAGIKGGASHGATDEIGHKAVDGRVSVHDLHATILHLMGIDHTRLTHLHNGRRFRLTDVSGDVIGPILRDPPKRA